LNITYNRFAEKEKKEMNLILSRKDDDKVRKIRSFICSLSV